MRFLFALIFSYLIFPISLVSQTCVPDLSISGSNIIPDTTTNFDKGFVNHVYHQIVQIKVPLDTSIVYNNTPLSGTVTYTKVKEIIGLPSGFTFSCNNSNCQVAGGSNGCVNIYGTPDISMLNQTFDLGISIEVVGIENSLQFEITLPDTVYGYRINIESEANSIDEEKFIESVNFHPNPIEANSLIYFNLSASSQVTLNMYDVLGNQVFSESDFYPTGKNSISIGNAAIPSGVYFLNINKGKSSITKKIIVK